MLAASLCAILSLLAVLHLYWGAGGVWPGRDEPSLVSIVIGRTRSRRMPGILPSAAVAACLATVAALVAWRSERVPPIALPDWLIELGYWAACAVFLARGVASFVPAIFRYADGTPFARLNRIMYAPLCLAIALGMMGLALMSGQR